MAKSKKSGKPFDVPKPPSPAKSAAATPVQPAQKSHAFRETVESIVIAFVLAFLFRTFEAEAFVIPTGSMAPTLMGRHKDVDCPKCGHRYQVSASEEAPDDPNQMPALCIAGMCPMCQYVMPMVPKDRIPPGVVEGVPENYDPQPSYNGDRILVNKYLYTFSDPQRWDVVVFKFPEDAKINYIKRLVGLPGETLRIFQGDLFVRDGDAKSANDFRIERKPPEKVLAMRQAVHDTNNDPVELALAGWPRRWQGQKGRDGGWMIESSFDGPTVRQIFNAQTENGGEGWLHYNHFTPTYEAWQTALGAYGKEAHMPEARPRLITDANPYNARITGAPHSHRLEVYSDLLGVHWVGDLMVEADVKVDSPTGQLMLELVEAGKKFRCTIDLANGEATLSAPGDDGYAPKAKTIVSKPGNYHLGFANVDDQLLLWVDGTLVDFDSDTGYDAEKVFGNRLNIRPQTSDSDPGDFAPVRIGAKDANLSITRLQVWRDIYYIADQETYERPRSSFITDFPSIDRSRLAELPYNPELWDLFDHRRQVEFPLHEDQFFVMGDNSAESSDARLWRGNPVGSGQHLERRLLIGKALSVYWPHSWNRIPGTPIPFPLFPNFEDMRLVR